MGAHSRDYGIYMYLPFTPIPSKRALVSFLILCTQITLPEYKQHYK